LVFATAPLFSLFLQEINSERARSAAGILGFSRQRRAKNSEFTAHHEAISQILTKTQSFAMCPIAMASRLIALGRNLEWIIVARASVFVNKLIYIIVFAAAHPAAFDHAGLARAKRKSLTR
jgi:hypothetical protein